jgi:ribosome-associated toxin RatA of RatAB toxin-antitoxin module
MREIIRSALVPQTPAEMFALVNDVARYPDFLPWCRGCRVLSESADALTATLDVGRAGIRVSLTTRNTMVPGERIEMTLAEGPFKSFTGVWRFEAIRARTDTGTPGAVKGCRVDLEVRFEFENAALDLLAGGLFESTWGTVVDAFVKRAREVYPSGG